MNRHQNITIKQVDCKRHEEYNHLNTDSQTLILVEVSETDNEEVLRKRGKETLNVL